MARTSIVLLLAVGALHAAHAARCLLDTQTHTWNGTAIVISKDMMGAGDER